MLNVVSAATKALLIAAVVGQLGTATASGYDSPIDEFVSRSGPDLPLKRYDAGDLGIVLPSYPRVYLYPAWRAIVLGREGLQKHPASEGGLARAIGSNISGWVETNNPQQPVNQWAVASASVVPELTGADKSGMIALTDAFSGYINCPQAAYGFATETLKSLSKRPDATASRLIAWVLAQHAVFGFCEYGASKFSSYQRPRAADKPIPRIPEPLPATEPLYWRQMREYQIAAGYFYDAQFGESARRFAAIGATTDHPMRAWGAYLALRSRLRDATLSTALKTDGSGSAPPSEKNEQLMRALRSDAERILADSTLAAMHEATRATLRTAQYRLTPPQRFAELSAALDDVTADPYADDHLVDWRRLANDLIDDYPSDKTQRFETPLRRRYVYFDWMRTLQRCGLESDLKIREESCRTEQVHAQEQWLLAAKETRAQSAGIARAWLVATLMLADTLTAPLEQAALAVPATAPEYLTVRYNLARLYRTNQQASNARSIAERGLTEVSTLGRGSVSAVNLFKQERFALATSLDDATRYLVRISPIGWNPDTGDRETSVGAARRPMPAADGLAWLNTRLAIKDLLDLAGSEQLESALRARIAVAAWMRADFLGHREQAEVAIRLVERNAPAFKSVAEQYRSLASVGDRRHWLLVNSLLFDLSPSIGAMDNAEEKWTRPLNQDRNEHVVAGMWCSVANPAGSRFADNNTGTQQAPSSSDVSTDAVARDKEMAELAKLKTATGFVGDHVLAWAKTHPNDPDLPWLLHVVVQSTRGGCLDDGASQLSKTAYVLLHKRFPTSIWTEKTPVWY